ncbi:MAG: RpiB/LacA/LacB family sugar-phosphate isomerase [Bacilli bacterium]|nr:RpiB/LacA/LacB family sugar-phosphate isomerase [Bacilli bacterium]
MKIGITSDHRGVYLKSSLIEYLEHAGYKVVNYGTDTSESVDFPKYALKLGKGVKKKSVDYGIAICGTGIGMSIALNKVDGIYCAKISNISEAVLCRKHNNANVVAISADINEELAKSMIEKFITTAFLNEEKYIRRNDMIKDIEENG